jgi:hypothetical protein
MTLVADHNLPCPERWRDRAQETLALARNAQEAQARERLLKVARSYRRLAVRAQNWKAARDRGRT